MPSRRLAYQWDFSLLDFSLLDFSDTNEVLIFAGDEQGLGFFQQRIRIRSWIYFIRQNVVYSNNGNAELSAQL
jgi:hypothetical protein